MDFIITVFIRLFGIAIIVGLGGGLWLLMHHLNVKKEIRFIVAVPIVVVADALSNFLLVLISCLRNGYSVLPYLDFGRYIWGVIESIYLKLRLGHGEWGYILGQIPIFKNLVNAFQHALWLFDYFSIYAVFNIIFLLLTFAVEVGLLVLYFSNIDPRRVFNKNFSGAVKDEQPVIPAQAYIDQFKKLYDEGILTQEELDLKSNQLLRKEQEMQLERQRRAAARAAEEAAQNRQKMAAREAGRRQRKENLSNLLDGNNLKLIIIPLIVIIIILVFVIGILIGKGFAKEEPDLVESVETFEEVAEEAEEAEEVAEETPRIDNPYGNYVNGHDGRRYSIMPYDCLDYIDELDDQIIDALYDEVSKHMAEKITTWEEEEVFNSMTFDHVIFFHKKPGAAVHHENLLYLVTRMDLTVSGENVVFYRVFEYNNLFYNENGDIDVDLDSFNENFGGFDIGGFHYYGFLTDEEVQRDCIESNRACWNIEEGKWQ